MAEKWYSEDFDPLEALNSNWKPLREVKPLENLHACRRLLPPNDPLYLRPNKPNEQQSKPTAPGLTDTEDEAAKITKQIDEKRKALMREQKKAAKAKTPKLSVIQQLAEKHKEGPLSMLHDIYQKKEKVVVHIRRVADMRGTCIGQLLAFDKHFNMFLKDVVEEFTVHCEVAEEKKVQNADGTVSTTTVYTRKLVPKTRKSPLLFIKGDTVALVSRYLDDTQQHPRDRRIGRYFCTG